MNPLETVAASFGIVSVYLSVRQNIWSWPTAIANVGLYTIVFYHSRLYADMGLQVVYIIISIYGWYHWLYGGKGHTELEVSRTTRRLGAILVGLDFYPAWRSERGFIARPMPLCRTSTPPQPAPASSRSG